jgi:hypothetical protein
MQKEQPNTPDRYADMLDLLHPTSARHPRMPIIDRAAQFAPFAALTGYDDAIEETARLTDSMLDMTEDRRELLDRRYQLLLASVERHPQVEVTFFLPDARKEGGSYQTVRGQLMRIDEAERIMHLQNGHRIALDAICNLDSEIFRGLL